MLDDNKNDTKLTDTKSTKLDAKRSKREDSIVPDCVIPDYEGMYTKGLKASEKLWEIPETIEMRCSEHCGNTVREVQ